MARTVVPGEWVKGERERTWPGRMPIHSGTGLKTSRERHGYGTSRKDLPERDRQETGDSPDTRYLLEELLSAELRHLRMARPIRNERPLQAMITLDSFFGVVSPTR